MTGKRSKERDGLDYKRTPYAFEGPKLSKWSHEKIPLLSSDPNAEVLTFTRQQHDDELLRFDANPIRIEYRMTTLAADGTRKALDSSADEQNNPMCYIDSMAEFSSFFRDAEVILDGHVITNMFPKPGELTGFYSHAQRIFMSNSQRKKHFGTGFFIENADQRFDLNDREFVKAVKTSKTATSRRLAISADGYPLIGVPDNWVMSRIAGKTFETSPSYLPPRTNTTVRLLRRDPDNFALENVTTAWTQGKRNPTKDDGKYFSSEAMEKENQSKNVRVEILDIYLAVQVCRIDPSSPAQKSLAEMDKTKLYWPFDHPTHYMELVTPGSRFKRSYITLDKSTPVVNFFFAYQDQLFGSKSSHKNVSYRMTMPTQVAKIKFFWKGGEIYFPDGLSKLQGKVNEGSLDSARYSDYLKERGLYDHDHPDPLPGEASYRNMFTIDLSPFIPEDDSPCNFEVHTYFTDEGLPADLNTVLQPVTRSVLERDGRSGSEPVWKPSSSPSR